MKFIITSQDSDYNAYVVHKVKMEKDIGMACQKVQGQMPESIGTDRDDIKVKAKYKSPIYPYIFVTLKKIQLKKDVGMGLCILAFTFLPCLHKNVMVSFSSMALCNHKPTNLEVNTKWYQTFTLPHSIDCLDQTQSCQSDHWFTKLGFSLKDQAFLASMSLYSFSHGSPFSNLYPSLILAPSWCQ